MASLSDIVLRDGLQWTDRWGTRNVSQITTRSLGGNALFFHAELFKGEPITLASTEDQGFQFLDTVTRLYELASVAGGQYLLNLGSIQRSVRFRHEDPPAFDAVPVVHRTLPRDGDLFSVTIKLITV